jgi:tryptophanyl-tRNA synthetase
LKSAVADAVVAVTEPFGKRVAELMADPAEIDRVLARGAERARPIAEATVRDVYDRVGFVPPADA